jgi:hypothetical protein
VPEATIVVVVAAQRVHHTTRRLAEEAGVEQALLEQPPLRQHELPGGFHHRVHARERTTRHRRRANVLRPRGYDVPDAGRCAATRSTRNCSQLRLPHADVADGRVAEMDIIVEPDRPAALDLADVLS